MPQRQAKLQSLAKDLDLFWRASRGVRRIEHHVDFRQPVLVMAILENGFKYVLAAIHDLLPSVNTISRAGQRSSGCVRGEHSQKRSHAIWLGEVDLVV